MVGQLEVAMTQQTPNPAAQAPSATPLLSVHSDLDSFEWIGRGNKHETTPWKLDFCLYWVRKICLVKNLPIGKILPIGILRCSDKRFYINCMHWKLTLSSKCPLWLSCFPSCTPYLGIGRWRTARMFLKCKKIRLTLHCIVTVNYSNYIFGITHWGCAGDYSAGWC